MKFINILNIAVLISFHPILSFGQKVTVRYMKTVPSKSFRDTKDSVIAYPIFVSTNKKLTDNLNKTVKTEFYEMYDRKNSEPIKSALVALSKEGLAELSYGEIRNDKSIISFEIYTEWIAAYPTYNQLYYTFDKNTGSRLTIDSLILPHKRSAFKKIIIKAWQDSIIKYRKDLSDQLKNKIINPIDYEQSLQYLKGDCLQSYSTVNFKMNKETIEIFFDCSFPRILRTMDPSDWVIIPLKNIREFLKEKYRL